VIDDDVRRELDSETCEHVGFPGCEFPVVECVYCDLDVAHADLEAMEDIAKRYAEALALIAALPAFPMRDIARRALGVVDEPAPRSTAELRAELEERSR
jgi:hypothetical protein